MSKHRRKYPVCTNCDFPFTKEQPDNYCPNCGQENHDLNVPFNHVALEVLEGTVHYDTKFWKTIKYLLFYPGRLTNEFHRGRRMDYVPPIRLYVFIGFIFFFLLSLRVGHATNEKENRSLAQEWASDDVQEMKKALTEEDQEDSLSAKVNRNLPQVAKDAGVDVKVDLDQKAVASKELEDSDSEDIENISPFASNQTIDSLLTKKGISANWYTRAVAKKTLHLIHLPKPELYNKLLKYISIMMFVLMPIFAFIMKVVFFRAKRYYMEHLMFSIHLHCFFLLLFIIYMLLTYLHLPVDLLGWFSLVGVIYLYLGLLRVFHRSKFRTAFNMLGLILLYFFASIFTLLLGTVASVVV